MTSELLAADALRSGIPEFFWSSEMDLNFKKILDQYRHLSISLDTGQMAA
jgi:hypothetical protein